ncbi:MAG: OsmC family protein [Dongiaceae bacterium]
MDADQLRTMQAPLKSRYREEPASALITLRATGRLGDDSITCKVETGRAIAEAGLHPATGGDGLSLCSGDMLLEALVACAGVTVKAVATALQVQIREGRVSAEGDLDFRGTLGVAKDAPVGFQAIRLRFDLDTDASAEQLDKLMTLTERYCVVYQSLSRPAALTVSRRTGRIAP